MPKVFIIILNWNGSRDTIDCLKSLEKLNYSPFEIVVVDNASTDDSAKNIKEGIKDLKNKILFIENEKNFGFSGGNNVGVDYALKNGTDYILFLNSDTTVDPEFLKILVSAGEADKEAGVLAPKIYFFDDPKIIWFGGGSFNWVFGSNHIDFGKRDAENDEKIRKTQFITGCAMLVKLNVFKKIGTLDEKFFLYYEDTDYSLRARKYGFSCVFVPSAKVWHKIPLESLKNKLSGAVGKIGSPTVLYYHYRNAMLLIKKNGPVLINLLKHFWAVWMISKQVFKMIFFPKKREISKAIIKGFSDYYKGNFGKISD
jgi:hypothetical protein